MITEFVVKNIQSQTDLNKQNISDNRSNISCRIFEYFSLEVLDISGFTGIYYFSLVTVFKKFTHI